MNIICEEGRSVKGFIKNPIWHGIVRTHNSKQSFRWNRLKPYLLRYKRKLKI